MNLIGTAFNTWAAAETPKQGGGASAYIYVLFIALIAGMYYMQRRAKKKAGDANAFRTDLGPGQRIMTTSGMLAVVSRVDGDVITVMSASGDESAWVRRAIAKLVSDDEWEAMTAEYPDEPDEESAPGASSEEPQPSAIEETKPTTDNPSTDS